MTKNRLYIGLAVSGALTLTLGVYQLQDARINALTQQVSALRDHQVEAIARAPRMQREPPSTDVALKTSSRPSTLAAQPVVETEVVAEEAAQPPATPEDQAAYVDSVFVQERSDPRWARESEATIADELRDRIGSSSLDSIECRATLCKARLSHGSQGSYSEFIDKLVTNSSQLWKGQVFALRDTVNDNGSVSNTIYFSKEGNDMPAL